MGTSKRATRSGAHLTVVRPPTVIEEAVGREVQRLLGKTLIWRGSDGVTHRVKVGDSVEGLAAVFSALSMLPTRSVRTEAARQRLRRAIKRSP